MSIVNHVRTIIIAHSVVHHRFIIITEHIGIVKQVRGIIIEHKFLFIVVPYKYMHIYWFCAS